MLIFRLKRAVIFVGLALFVSLSLAACGATTTSAPVTQPAAEATLSEWQVATLNSLQKVDDFPLYLMHY